MTHGRHKKAVQIPTFFESTLINRKVFFLSFPLVQGASFNYQLVTKDTFKTGTIIQCSSYGYECLSFRKRQLLNCYKLMIK